MTSIYNAISRRGTEVEIGQEGGYTGCVHIIYKGVNTPFKGYLGEEFERCMVTNGLRRRRPNRGEMAQWVKVAWEKVTLATIVNTWRSVGKNKYEEATKGVAMQAAFGPLRWLFSMMNMVMTKGKVQLSKSIL
jgi:hypothetical protein